MCGKSGAERVNLVDIRGGELTQVDKLKYLDTTTKEGGGWEVEIQDRVKAAWAKWKEVSEDICD